MGLRHPFLAVLFALLCGFVAPAQAQDTDEPEFLLSDLGLRVDLPNNWHMTRWSSFDLKADTKDPILLQAWGTDVQTDPSKVDAKAWKEVYDAKLEEMGAAPDGISLDKAEVAEVQGKPAAYLDYSFKLKSGTPAVLKGATIAVDGQMFHLALVSIKKFDKKTATARDELMDRLDIQSPAADVTWAPTLEGDGFTHTVPEDWREPLKAELGVVNKQISSLGLEKLDGCWLAMRPMGPDAPEAMVSCQGGLLLGVVDEYSFEGVEPTVRAKMFGGAEVPPGRMVALSDRVAFVYDLHDKGLAVAVVPYDKGVVRTWVKGAPGDEALAGALEATLQSSTYSGEHPASLGDRVGYYLSYRPFSPVVLCPVLGLLVIGGVLVLGAVFMMGGRKDKYADLADDD